MSNKLIDWYPKLANKYHVSLRVIENLADLLQRSKGEEARFDIPELGGKGIWKLKQGAQIGNGFNEALNKRAGELCGEIASLVRAEDRDQTTFLSSLEDTISILPDKFEDKLIINWWDAHLGNEPDLLGNAGTMRFAYFESQNRLAIQYNLRNRLFDTENFKVLDVVVGRAPGFFNTIIKTDNGDMLMSKLREVLK